MKFNSYLIKEHQLWESTDLKTTIKNRQVLVKALQKYSGMVEKTDRKDFKRAIELVKPQNNLTRITESEINEASPTNFAKTIKMLLDLTEDVLKLPYDKKQEKLVKTDYENLCEAASIVLTVKFIPLMNTTNENSTDFFVQVPGNKDSVFGIGNDSWSMSPCVSDFKAFMRDLGNIVVGAAVGTFLLPFGGAALGAIAGFGYDEREGFRKCNKIELQVLRKYYDLAGLIPGVDIVMYDDIVKELDKGDVSTRAFLNNNYFLNPKNGEFMSRTKYREMKQKEEAPIGKGTEYVADVLTTAFGGAVIGTIIGLFIIGIGTGDFGTVVKSAMYGGMFTGILAAIMPLLGETTNESNQIDKIRQHIKKEMIKMYKKRLKFKDTK